MNLNQLDLNLLIILKQLLAEKHISNTALTLGISQPSISRSLSKLRNLFDDPLLIRMAGGYELTPKAQSLEQDLNAILNMVETLVNKQDFDPKTSEATIKIFGLPPQMHLLLDNIIKDIREQAPNITLEIDTLPKPQFSDLLKGDTHFVITGHKPENSQGKLYRQALFERNFKLIMATDHPLADKELNVGLLRDCNFGQISIQGEKELSIAHCFSELGINNISTPVRLKNFYSIGSMTESTDLIFYVPDHFANDICRHHNVIAKAVPEQLKTDHNIVYLYWHQRHNNDPVCQWFRELLKSKVFKT
jgi:DNA-binding transcriptional LysR family regulator